MRPRIAVTSDTPTHAERLLLNDDRHLIDAAVTFDATDTGRDVNAVIEVRVIREQMNPHPFDWVTRLRALSNQL
jgi:hypothetical protein